MFFTLSCKGSLYCLFLQPDCLLWRRGVFVITAAQHHSTKHELKICAGTNPAWGVSEICDGENLWQWSRLEIRLNEFYGPTIPQKLFIIIIIMGYLPLCYFSDLSYLVENFQDQDVLILAHYGNLSFLFILQAYFLYLEKSNSSSP